MLRPFQIAALFVLLLLLLGYGIQESGLAGAFSDRVSGAHAQDETTYASSAVGLATGSGWLTPKVLGRFYLVKPPLLIWLAGLSMRVFGISLLALRLPVLLAGVLATLMLFLWSERRYSRWTAAAVILLAVANPLWHTFSRVCYTDMLLALAMIGALWSFDRDWTLGRPREILLFAAFLAFGLMAKNVAGLLPLPIVVLACLVAGRPTPIANLLKACLVAALLVAPWHLYQAISHPRWFWTDYVQIQLLEFGLKPPIQPSSDGPVWFYLRRFLLTDPLLALLGLLALPSLIRALRTRQPEAALLFSWALVAGGALLIFHYRNLPYLLYAIPPLCIIAAVYALPHLITRPAVAAAALVVVLAVKAASPAEVWGVPYGSVEVVSSARWFRWYAEQRRPNELIAVNSDDEFYATALPIPKIHYCYLDPDQLVRRYAPHYAFLGITVSTAQFLHLDRWEPQFRERLERWGLASDAPIATNIMSGSVEDILRLIATRLQSDFYLPADIVAQLSPEILSTRRIMRLSPERSFLLASSAPDRGFSCTSWRLPKEW